MGEVMTVNRIAHAGNGANHLNAAELAFLNDNLKSINTMLENPARGQQFTDMVKLQGGQSVGQDGFAAAVTAGRSTSSAIGIG